MISMSVGHSLSFSSLRRITNCVHYESFENSIFHKFQEKAQISCFMMTWMSLQPLTIYDTNQITSLTSHCISLLVRSFWDLTKPSVLTGFLCL